MVEKSPLASAVEARARRQAGSLVSQLDVVLKPLSRPELGEIRIDGDALTIGRTEQPFASHRDDVLKHMSRRHARIFRKDDVVYVEDLDSRRGTTVNRVAIGRTPCRLYDGDEICFGDALSYRLEIGPRTRSEMDLTLSLTPKSADAGFEAIVISHFPFLLGKSDSAFSRYTGKSEHGRHLRYLSRRHACVYEQDGQAYIRDLGSHNGTFVDGLRLQEHPVALKNGAVVALGGEPFVYEVSIVRRDGQEATASDHEPPAEGASNVPPARDKTQFVATPTLFLRIYGGTDEPEEGPQADAAVPAVPAKDVVIRHRPRGRARLLWSELASLIASDEPGGARKNAWRAAAVAGVFGVLALTAYFWNAPQRNLKDALGQGDYARAAVLANRLLEKRPDDVELKALTTETLLKADVPPWLVKIRARDFEGAQSVLASMTQLGAHDAELRPLVDELDWLGNLERLVSGRGGAGAPMRIYADEDSIGRLIGHWNDDTDEHQRALVRIASYVPQFNDWYGEALSHLRTLQSESAVYVPVIERLKASIATDLARDNPDALEPLLQQTAEKYPGLGGLDSVRGDLERYIEIRQYAGSAKPARLFALLRKARFVTPPFAQSFRALMEGGQLPSADLLQQYDAATQAWMNGKTSDAFAVLQKIAAGPWGQDAGAELERRRGVTARFGALEQSRNAGNFVDQLLAFRESLDPEEDVYFLRATAADVNDHRDTVIVRAQDALRRARTSWEEYQRIGVIDASRRIETSISDQFRTRARLLAEASKDAQQGFATYMEVDAAGAAQWVALRDEIESEAREQRSKLRDLSNVLEPELLNAKLALLGDPNE
jgi:pSer/pThr/pTyr-binding forkhead associated (FHA) protein